MKKSITAPLCSALVIPGLGQILNQQIRKGLILLGLVFLLFVAGAVKLTFIITSLAPGFDLAEASQAAASLSRGDLLLMAGFLIAFAVLWVYSVVDAFWVAFQVERSSAQKLAE
jgi:TM2 domain-containing membrane protein YozV